MNLKLTQLISLHKHYDQLLVKIYSFNLFIPIKKDTCKCISIIKHFNNKVSHQVYDHYHIDGDISMLGTK